MKLIFQTVISFVIIMGCGLISTGMGASQTTGLIVGCFLACIASAWVQIKKMK